MRVKIFSSSGASWLEREMNDWLEVSESQIVIISIDPISVTNANGLNYVCKITYTNSDKLFENTSSE